MKIKIAGVLILCFILPTFFCGCRNSAAAREKLLPETYKNHIYEITASGKNFTASGYGVRLSDCGYILTVAHLFDDEYEKITLTSPHIPGKKYEGRLVRRDTGLDLALVCDGGAGGLKTAPGTPPYYRLSKENFFVETKIGREIKAAVSGKPDTLLVIDGTVEKGASGTPILSTSGYVAGVICARDTQKNRSYAVSSKTIEKFLRLQSDFSVPPLSFGGFYTVSNLKNFRLFGRVDNLRRKG